MDLLARKRMLFVLIVWGSFICVPVQAQTYSFQKVEYFPTPVKEEKKSQEMDFSLEELWQSPDIAYAFLTNPSLEAGKKYLLWQQERLKHLQNAMKILNQILEDP